ncbi:MAG: MTH1187 family thiamine-binding protein [Magnetococcales bacterium]|nr:MTH1187 family thiamine-binding protein [Magnetococcales bacterium]
MSVLLEFSMTPLDKGESVSPYVSRSLDIIDKSGIPYKLGPMGTCLEGEWDEVMGVVKACLERMQEDCVRISISIKADYRKEGQNRLAGKIASVEGKVGRPLQK